MKLVNCRVVTSAQQVSKSVESISVGAQEQADEVQTSTEVMELLAERIVGVNENVSSVLDVAERIKSTSKNATNYRCYPDY